MKVYAYYLKLPSLTPRLYAFTDQKDLAKGFEDQREPSMFIRKKFEMKKKDYFVFKHDYPNSQLTSTQLLSKDSNDPTKRTLVPIICTWEEEKNTISSQDSIYPEMFAKYMFDPSKFTIEIQRALYILGYFDMYKWLYSSGYIYEMLDESIYDGVMDIKYDDTDECIGVVNRIPEVDDFAVFMMLYGHTMKTG